MWRWDLLPSGAKGQINDLAGIMEKEFVEKGRWWWNKPSKSRFCHWRLDSQVWLDKEQKNQKSLSWGRLWQFFFGSRSQSRILRSQAHFSAFRLLDFSDYIFKWLQLQNLILTTSQFLTLLLKLEQKCCLQPQLYVPFRWTKAFPPVFSPAEEVGSSPLYFYWELVRKNYNKIIAGNAHHPV